MLAGSCIWSAVNKYQNGTTKVAKKASNMGRSGTQYVAINGYRTVKLVLESTFSRILLQSIKHFWYKLAEISFFILFGQSLVECMTSLQGKLHILKTRISLCRKEIFENSKQHFSSHTDYLFTFENGFDRKNVISVRQD